MFTGIIELTGKVVEKTRGRITILPAQKIKDIQKGESFSIDGVCLTVLESKLPLMFELSPLTEKNTTLRFRKTGDVVNIERSLRAGERMGGHFVLGHIDGVGYIREWRRLETGCLIAIEFPYHLTPFVVEKGAITVDGISLTIQKKAGNVFTCAILPYTYENTGLRFKKRGDAVNLETDIIARYVAEMLGIWKDKREKIKRFLEEVW